LTPFPDGSRDVALVTNFRVKIGKIGLFAFIRSPDIPKRIAMSPFDFKKFIRDDPATSCKNLVNFGAETPEFKRAKV